MAESYVVDASVVAKWFNRGEENEAEARALKDAHVAGRVSLYAPNLLFFEVANAIWKNPGIRTKTASSLVRILARLSPQLLHPREKVSEEAMSLARKSRLTLYDSIYLALAKSLSSVLITADKEQLSVAAGYTEALSLSAIPQSGI